MVLIYSQGKRGIGVLNDHNQITGVPTHHQIVTPKLNLYDY